MKHDINQLEGLWEQFPPESEGKHQISWPTVRHFNVHGKIK